MFMYILDTQECCLNMCLNVQCCVFSLVIIKIPRKISTVKSYLFKIAFYCRWKGFSQFKSFDHLGKFLEIVMGWWLDDNVATMTKIMRIGEHDEKLKANQANDEIKRNNMKMERNKKRKKKKKKKKHDDNSHNSWNAWVLFPWHA